MVVALFLMRVTQLARRSTLPVARCTYLRQLKTNLGGAFVMIIPDESFETMGRASSSDITLRIYRNVISVINHSVT